MVFFRDSVISNKCSCKPAQDAIWTSCLAPFTLPCVFWAFSEQTVQLSCRRVKQKPEEGQPGEGPVYYPADKACLFCRHLDGEGSDVTATLVSVHLVCNFTFCDVLRRTVNVTVTVFSLWHYHYVLLGSSLTFDQLCIYFAPSLRGVNVQLYLNLLFVLLTGVWYYDRWYDNWTE